MARRENRVELDSAVKDAWGIPVLRFDYRFGDNEKKMARMGSDPKTSVTNSFGQTHDVKNLFVVDGSIFVSASCQNPTWTILALCWRAMDYLKEEMRTSRI